MYNRCTGIDLGVISAGTNKECTQVSKNNRVLLLTHITVKTYRLWIKPKQQSKVNFLQSCSGLTAHGLYWQIKLIDASRYQVEIYVLPSSCAVPNNRLLLNYKKSSVFPFGISLTPVKVLHGYMLLWLRSERAYSDQCWRISNETSNRGSLWTFSLV